MKVLINAVSAKMGGAATYIKSLARELAALNLSDEFIFYVPEEQARAISGLASNIFVISTDVGYEPFWKRLWFDQVTLRRFMKREKVDVLYSITNLAMFACPRRQILLVHNALHFSKLYLSRFLPRKGWVARFKNSAHRWLICRSVKSADVVMTPSQTMMGELRQFVTVPPEKAIVNPFGTKVRSFQSNELAPEPPKGNEMREYRLLYSSLYADHKNLTVLLEALIYLVESGVRCRLITSANPNLEAARTTSGWRRDAQLAADPRISSLLEFTGIMTSDKAAELYRRADVFVYPSVVESFGYPLVEAMAEGVPIIAADTAINREICHKSVLYFKPFDAHDFARQIRRVIEDPALYVELTERGLQRCKSFQWKNHVAQLIDACYSERIGHTTVLQGINQ